MIVVDTDSDPAVWLAMPLEWDSPDAHRLWARQCADLLWTMDAQGPVDASEVDRLALKFAMFAEDIPGRVLADQVYLYEPDPRRTPLPFFIVKLTSEGEKQAQLRSITQADAPGAERPVEVDVFTTPRLGEGLRTLRYFTSKQGDLRVSLNFAWRSEQLGIDLSLRTVLDDPGWLAVNLDRFDSFAQSIWLRRA